MTVGAARAQRAPHAPRAARSMLPCRLGATRVTAAPCFLVVAALAATAQLARGEASALLPQHPDEGQPASQQAHPVLRARRPAWVASVWRTVPVPPPGVSSITRAVAQEGAKGRAAVGVGVAALAILLFALERWAAAARIAKDLKGSDISQSATYEAEAEEPEPEIQAEEGLPLLGDGAASAAGCGWAKKLEAAFWLIAWMLGSIASIVFNKWLFTVGGFPYPLVLTTMHMACCFIAFSGFRHLAPNSLCQWVMPDAGVEIPWPMFVRGMLPIALVFACSLGSGNIALLLSSVAFVQMVKPIIVVFASIAAFIFGLEAPTRSHIIIVSIVAAGVSMAARGDLEFNMLGCTLIFFSCLCEGVKLALLQVVTTRGLSLDPVTTVYHYSPIVALCLGCTAFFIEGSADSWQPTCAWWLLAANCLMALVLNVLIVKAVKVTSAVVTAMTGPIKDIVLIGISVYFFGSPISGLQVCGYSISLAGMFMYKAYKDQLEHFKKCGFVGGFRYALFGAA